MALDFPGHGDAMRRTLEIAERCSVELELDRILLPKFPVPDGRDAFDFLVELCEKGLARALPEVTDELRERLRYELKTIKEMGFTDYFLIVWDFIHFAKQQGISVGPGRGSAAGSIVAYSLQITDLDPIRYDLMFERFLNPGRKTMPDMDIDFAVAGRERVINYVTEKYGRDRVAQIITFSTMAARAAVRDAGRVLEIPYGAVDRIAKLIPEGPGQTLEECLKPGAELRKAVDSDPVAKEIVDLARPLEGLDASRLDPRRRRRDRRRAADERRAAAAEGRRPGSRHPVPDEGRRGARAAEDGLPRPAQPRRDRQGMRAGRQAGRAAFDIAAIPLDDKATYEMLAAARRPASSSSSPRGCARRCGRWGRPSSRMSSPSAPSTGRGRCSTSRTTPRARTARSRSPTSTRG